MVRLHRERLGLSQGELAQRIGVTQENISQIEGGKVWPSLEHAQDLAAALRTSIDELLGGLGGGRVVHYHAAGEVRVWVANGGMVILGNLSQEQLTRVSDLWQELRRQGQAEADTETGGHGDTERNGTETA